MELCSDEPFIHLDVALQRVHVAEPGVIGDRIVERQRDAVGSESRLDVVGVEPEDLCDLVAGGRAA